MRGLSIILVSLVAVGGLAAWASGAAKLGTATDAGTQMPASTHTAMGMQMDLPLPVTPVLATELAAARLATAKYVTNLARAKADGYRSQITQMMPGMGYHFLNPNVKGFDVTKPPILVYEKLGRRWQLGAFEWVFTSRPSAPPLPGATYGSFGAACHYVDGTFVYQIDQNACATTSPKSSAHFSFWHPNLVTLHVWLWYPNPDGIYAGMNPLVRPFNAG